MQINVIKLKKKQKEQDMCFIMLNVNGRFKRYILFINEKKNNQQQQIYIRSILINAFQLLRKQ